jgi:hypothetical protein
VGEWIKGCSKSEEGRRKENRISEDIAGIKNSD